MKPQEQKLQFIKLRSEGKSYSTISKSLNISKSTCQAWEQEFKTAITELKKEQLNELYESYYMTKKSRIEQFGETLNNINNALTEADLSEIPPEKLLEYKLKYMEALNGEYVGGGSCIENDPNDTEIDPENILLFLMDLLNRAKAGEVKEKQINSELTIIKNILQTYDTIKIKSKLEALDSVLESR